MSIPTHSLFRFAAPFCGIFLPFIKYVLFFAAHTLVCRRYAVFNWWKPEWEIIWFGCTKVIMKRLWIILDLIMEYSSVCNCAEQNTKKSSKSSCLNNETERARTHTQKTKMWIEHECYIYFSGFALFAACSVEWFRNEIKSHTFHPIYEHRNFVSFLVWCDICAHILNMKWCQTLV